MPLLRTIVLASASPRRLELLRSLHLDVRTAPSGYAEPDDASKTPRDLSRMHARHKCLAVRRHFPNDVVVGADTSVDLDGTAYGKPTGRADATRMLRALSGRSHLVHTAFALAVPGRPAPVQACESTLVTFFALTASEIAAYVDSGEPHDKAGAYGIQGYGATLVRRVEGDFFTVMGFPLARFVRALRRLGFALPVANDDAYRTAWPE